MAVRLTGQPHGVACSDKLPLLLLAGPRQLQLAACQQSMHKLLPRTYNSSQYNRTTEISRLCYMCAQ
jgi:hypothetical protein